MQHKIQKRMQDSIQLYISCILILDFEMIEIWLAEIDSHTIYLIFLISVPEGVRWLYHSEVYGAPSDDILLESIVTRKYKEWTKVRKLVRKNNTNTKKPLFLAIFEFLSGGDDGTWTHTVLPPPDFKSDASADSATSPYPL